MALPYRVTWRDRLAHTLANAALRLATKEYRAYVSVLVHLGEQALPEALAHDDANVA